MIGDLFEFASYFFTINRRADLIGNMVVDAYVMSGNYEPDSDFPAVEAYEKQYRRGITPNDRQDKRDMYGPVTARFETPSCLVPTVDGLCPLQTVNKLIRSSYETNGPCAKVKPTKKSVQTAVQPSSLKSRTHNWLDDTVYEQAWDGVADSAHDEQAWSGAAASADATPAAAIVAGDVWPDWPKPDDADTDTNVVAKPDNAETKTNVVDKADDAETKTNVVDKAKPDDAETKSNVVDKAKPDDAETATNVVNTRDDANTELKSAVAKLQAALKNVVGAKVSLNVTLNSGESSTQQRTPRVSRWFFSKWWMESMKSVLSIGASGPAGPPVIIR
jgi:hypothetical protein